MDSGEQISITGKAGLSPEELAEAQALKAVCDAAENLDLKLAWGEEAGAGPERVFLARAGGRLVGYCALDGSGRFMELCGMVHPDWRRRKAGTRLWEAARAAFRKGGGEQLFVICENGSESGRWFIQALTGQRAFSEHRMVLRDLAPLPEGRSTGELTVRLIEDEAGVRTAAEITSRAFGRAFEQTLAFMRSSVAEPHETVYLALGDGEPVGTFKLFADGADVGIYGFAIDPVAQRRGWGRRMLARACEQARVDGAGRILLEVETDNERAYALYSSSGFETITTYGYYVFSPTLLALGLNAPGAEEFGGE